MDLHSELLQRFKELLNLTKQLYPEVIVDPLVRSLTREDPRVTLLHVAALRTLVDYAPALAPQTELVYLLRADVFVILKRDNVRYGVNFLMRTRRGIPNYEFALLLLARVKELQELVEMTRNFHNTRDIVDCFVYLQFKNLFSFDYTLDCERGILALYRDYDFALFDFDQFTDDLVWKELEACRGEVEMLRPVVERFYNVIELVRLYGKI